MKTKMNSTQTERDTSTKQKRAWVAPEAHLLVGSPDDIKSAAPYTPYAGDSVTFEGS